MADQSNPRPRDDRQVRVLVFAASLRPSSLNERLAALAATVVQEHGAIADRAAMTDFDCPSYDADEEKETGIPPAPGGSATACSRPTRSSSHPRNTTPRCRAT